MYVWPGPIQDLDNAIYDPNYVRKSLFIAMPIILSFKGTIGSIITNSRDQIEDILTREMGNLWI